MRDRFAHCHLRSHVRDNNLIKGNILRNCNDFAINVAGNDAVVSDNSIFGCAACIEIGKFRSCDATGSLTQSLLSDGHNPTVTGNTVTGCLDGCIYVGKFRNGDATRSLTRFCQVEIIQQ